MSLFSPSFGHRFMLSGASGNWRVVCPHAVAELRVSARLLDRLERRL